MDTKTKEDAKRKAACRETLIRGVDIHKRYVMGKDNFVDALRGASLEVLQGEMLGIMGPSGSGKSTLLHILGCLDSLDSGEVWLDDRRVDNLAARRAGPAAAHRGGVHLPDLQPGAEPHRRRERHAGGRVRRQREARSARSVQECSLPRGAVRSRETSSHGAVRRSAAAGGHRPGPGERTQGHLRRRTHRQPGLGQLGRDRGDDAPRSTARRAPRSSWSPTTRASPRPATASFTCSTGW